MAFVAIFIVGVLASLTLGNSRGTTNQGKPESLSGQNDPREVVMAPEVESTAEVIIENQAFTPPTVRIKVGEVVSFTNLDSVAHTATADDGISFDTGLLEQNETAQVSFDKAGTYNYHCTPHPNMKATIIVE